jgi:hypothetical protein
MAGHKKDQRDKHQSAGSTTANSQMVPAQTDDLVEDLQARVLALSPEDKGRLLQSYGVPTEETKESDF